MIQKKTNRSGGDRQRRQAADQGKRTQIGGPSTRAYAGKPSTGTPAGRSGTGASAGRSSTGTPAGRSGTGAPAGRPSAAARATQAPSQPQRTAYTPAPELAQQQTLPEDLLYGSNPVREALRAGRPVSRVWVALDRNDRIAGEIINHCHNANIPYSKVERAYLDRMCQGEAHQGFAARTAPKSYTPWQEMQKMAESKGEAPIILVLDEVEDPHNLGAVLRSVDALGGHGVVIPKHRAAQLTAGVGRASAGAWAYVPVDRVTNIARTLEEMKKEGFWVIGATADADGPIYDVDWTGPVALVLGGENKGLSPTMRKKCDILASIPITGRIESLNVSAAAAIILAEINRRRAYGR